MCIKPDSILKTICKTYGHFTYIYNLFFRSINEYTLYSIFITLIDEGEKYEYCANDLTPNEEKAITLLDYFSESLISPLNIEDILDDNLGSICSEQTENNLITQL